MHFTGTHRAALAAALLATTAPLHAQGTDSVAIDPHWRPYFGCWLSSSAGSVGPTTCIVPTASAQTVEMLAIVNDSIIARTSITASPTRAQQERDGCRGWETGRWSGSAHRLFTRAEFTCEGSSPQASTGIFALSDADAFSRIEGVTTANGTRIRVMNYVRLENVFLPPPEAARLQRSGGLPALAARADAAAPITLADVGAAVKEVDSTVVAAWLADRGQRFALAPKELRQLRAAGVPTSIIDMMIAVSHPTVFTVAASGEASTRAPLAAQQQRDCLRNDLACLSRGLRNNRIPYYGSLVDAMYGYGYGTMYNPYSYGLGSSRLASFGYWLPFGMWNGPYGYGAYGNAGYGYGQYGNGPFIILPNRPANDDSSPGRVVNGRGYSQNGGSSSGTARPTPSVSNGSGWSSGGGGTAAGSSSGGSSAGSSPAGGAAGGAGTGRTAKERP